MIAIGKIGQKIIFDRSSKECQRSNTNGNVGSYTLFNMLIQCLPRERFCVVGESDHGLLRDNVTYEKLPCSFGIFMVGINDDKDLIDYINRTELKYILVCDDERCLDALNNNKRLTHLPIEIISQSNSEYCFHGRQYTLRYLPIERTVLFNSKQSRVKKTTVMSCLANYSDVYDRLGAVDMLTKLISINIYGRLDGSKLYDEKFMGEVNYEQAQKILRESLSTLIVPVKKGVITSKYVEALMNDTIPVLYKDYGHQLLEDFPKELIVGTSFEVKRIYQVFERNQELVNMYLTKLKNRYIYPYLDGQRLTSQIMEVLK